MTLPPTSVPQWAAMIFTPISRGLWEGMQHHSMQYLEIHAYTLDIVGLPYWLQSDMLSTKMVFCTC